ncbi:hypothetical protein [Methylovulum psychrotolerans]|uniref:hypothetical protein n=1 Tax=Methylovulum psychrotolerans TaxID=1704499 RepID=UPI000CDEF3E0|nr:hypothetical protein [Methylovulum psychrotolerans]
MKWSGFVIENLAKNLLPSKKIKNQTATLACSKTFLAVIKPDLVFFLISSISGLICTASDSVSTNAFGSSDSPIISS